jgi:hypothetical protein
MAPDSCNNCIHKAGACRIRTDMSDSPCDHYQRVKTERKCRWCGANTEVSPHVKKVICKTCFKSIANAYENAEKMLEDSGNKPNCLVM